MAVFRWRHFAGEIILWAVRWYCRYGISYRELEEMMGERGVAVDHTTLYVGRSATRRSSRSVRPGTAAGCRSPGGSKDLCAGQGVLEVPLPRDRQRWRDARLLPRRPANAKAAKRFLSAALKRSRDWIPRVINTDKNPAYGEALAELKQEGLLPKETQHRQVKYLNNRLEGDHGKLKRLIKPTRAQCGKAARWDL
jgi:transposase, IS6 family